VSTRRVLITGVSGPLGARLATRLAADPAVESVVGIDTRRPPGALADRITFVEAELRRGDLAPILRVAAPHVVIHHDIVQFPEPGRSRRTLHDLNVIGTLQLLAAASEVPVLRQLVVRSSASIYGSAPDAPAFFTEDLAGGATLHTRFQRDVAELERLVEAFARRHPAVTTTVLRLQPVIGTGLDTPIMRLFRSPVVPTFLGFDPRLQLLLDEDAIGAVAAAVRTPVRGAVNVAGDGTVSLARMLRRLGKRALPIASPIYGPTVAALARAGVVPALDDDVIGYLRNGRGVDTTRMRADLRFVPTHTTVEAIDAVAEQIRAAGHAPEVAA
jgi:UDP-glucose 4-epimerase